MDRITKEMLFNEIESMDIAVVERTRFSEIIMSLYNVSIGMNNEIGSGNDSISIEWDSVKEINKIGDIYEIVLPEIFFEISLI